MHETWKKARVMEGRDRLAGIGENSGDLGVLKLEEEKENFETKF